MPARHNFVRNFSQPCVFGYGNDIGNKVSVDETVNAVRVVTIIRYSKSAISAPRLS